MPLRQPGEGETAEQVEAERKAQQDIIDNGSLPALVYSPESDNVLQLSH